MLNELANFLGTYAGEVTAVCALLLTTYQLVVTRRHNILSVQPHLTTSTHRDTTEGKAVLVHRLLNNGLGPAFIRSFQIYLDGVPVEDADDAINSVVPAKRYKKTVTKLGNDYAMSEKESADILVLICDLEEGETLDQIEKELSRLDLVVNYASAYNRVSCFDARENKPQR